MKTTRPPQRRTTQSSPRPFSPVAAGLFPIALAAFALGHDNQGLHAQGEDEYARALAWSRPVAVPENMRPRRFVIADYLIGPGPDARALDNGLQALANLGINSVEIKLFGDLQSTSRARARQLGIDRTRRAIYAPIGSQDKQPALYFDWNTEPLSAPALESFGRYQAGELTKLGTEANNVSIFHMADEPGWYFPDIAQKMVATPQRLEQFRAWLRTKNLTPADLGAASWNEVYPIGFSQARDLGGRRLFYWTTRYPVETSSDAYAKWTRQLRRSVHDKVLVTSNWNNQVNRWYLPSANRAVGKNPDQGPDAAMGMMDWMDVGRKRAISALWSEDWFRDIDAQNWSYYADALRCAAREGDDANYRAEFGGYIVGKRLGDHPSGGKYKALALIGHGAKAIEWYSFGPESKFKGNAYSANQAAYGAIADANRLIGRAEDLLFPGRRGNARIALLLPGSAQVWDTSPELPLYQREVAGLHFALTHAQYPVDVVDETGIAAGDLTKRGFNLLFVTSPNLSAASQTALRDWIQNGGTAVFSPGAAAADEYNTPTSTLNAARGVRAQIGPRLTISDGAKNRSEVVFRDATWGQSTSITRDVQPLQISGATVVAEANGQPVVANNRFGRGLAVSYGFWPGAAYYDSPQRADQSHLPSGWNAALRSIATGAPRVTRVPKPVDVSVPVVEAARLDSAAGSAITLLNWTDQPLDAVTLTVRNAGAVKSVGLAETGSLNFTREGESIRVTLPLRDVDVLMLRF